MRKFIIFLMSAMMMISLAACTPTKTKIETTTAPEIQVPASTGGASDKVPDPTAESMEIISVYNEKDDGSGLNQAMDAVSTLSAQAIVDKLIEYGVLEEGTEVLKFDNKDGVGTLDLSQVPESDAKKDTLMMTSVGNTFIENYELDKLMFRVNGKNYTEKNDGYLVYVKEYGKIK